MMRTVLVVDDVAEVREVVRTMLESRGHTVAVAPNGAAAIAAFEYAQFDLALIDVDMPDVTGPELVRTLRRLCAQTGRKLRAALMTGIPREGLHGAAREAGAACVLSKPFSMSDLVATVERLCDDEPVALPAA